MTRLQITPNIDLAPWADLDGSAHGFIERVGLLPEGMASGDPSFALAARLDDGSTVILEASWAQIKLAMHALDVSPIAPKTRNRGPAI